MLHVQTAFDSDAHDPMVRHAEHHLARARTAKRESRYLDFKDRFDPDSTGEWVELIKDLVAMANSGGGVIVIGVRNNGDPAGSDVSRVIALDPATIADKINRYTGENFADFEVHEVKRRRQAAAALLIGPAETPIAFTHVGTYEVTVRGGKQKQKTAF